MLRLMIYLSTPILLPGYLPGTPAPLWLNASEELAPPDRAFMIAGINGQIGPCADSELGVGVLGWPGWWGLGLDGGYAGVVEQGGDGGGGGVGEGSPDGGLVLFGPVQDLAWS